METTVPRKAKCAKCCRDVLTGLLYGERLSVDPNRLTLEGEADALVCGIPTYTLSVLGKAQPFRRTVPHILDGKPKHGYIHAAHVCEKHWPTTMIDKEQIFDRQRSEQPPF